MNLEFYGLRDDPFSDEPSADLFFNSKTHSAALDGLLSWSQSSTPIVLITGEKGSGKTLLSFKLADLLADCDEPSCIYLSPGDNRLTMESLVGSVGKISHIQLSGEDEYDAYRIWSEVINHLSFSYGRGISPHEIVYEQLAESDSLQRLYLIVDDAHRLPAAAVRQLEEFSLLKPPAKKSIQMAMFFPPLGRGVGESFKNPGNAIQSRIVLGPLTREETSEYIYFRLYRAGAPGIPSFTEEALDSVYNQTGGNPELINRVCRRALAFGAALQAVTLDRRTILSEENEDGAMTPSATVGNEVAEQESPPAAVLPKGRMVLFAETNSDLDMTANGRRLSQIRRKSKAPKRGDNKNTGLKVFVISACALLVLMLLSILLDFKRFFTLFF